MTWGIKRRARAANILADLGKIVMAATVVGPLVQPAPISVTTIIWGLLGALACFGFAIWSEREAENDRF